jgi:hypothetical protein
LSTRAGQVDNGKKQEGVEGDGNLLVTVLEDIQGVQREIIVLDDDDDDDDDEAQSSASAPTAHRVAFEAPVPSRAVKSSSGKGTDVSKQGSDAGSSKAVVSMAPSLFHHLFHLSLYN